MVLGEDMALEWGCLMAILIEVCLMPGLHHMLTEEHLSVVVSAVVAVGGDGVAIMDTTGGKFTTLLRR